jgi:hypothetical protein
MSLAEGVQARVTYKAYSTGVITAGTQPVSASDPGASAGQILRRTTCTLDLKKDTYTASEVSTDRQISDFRHGKKHVDGSLNGELSPGTYFDFFEAACRGTKGAAVALTESDLTSAVLDNTAATVVFGGGNPHTLGLRVGDVIRFTNLATAANDGINFLITSMSAANNRTVGLYPAPTTETIDSAFNVTTVGKSIFVPSSSFVSRKFGVEVYHSDVDVHRFFTELRVGGVKFNLPPTGLATLEIPMMGRDMETASGASSPFFTSPTAATSTGLTAAVNGLVQVAGVTQGVITGASIDFSMAMSGDAVVGQNFIPEIFLGRADVKGQLTAFFQDLTLLNYFVNETEVSLLFYLTSSSSAAADAITIYLPRVKLGGATVGITGEAGQAVTLPFQALKYATAGTGIEATTIRITDTAAA